MNKLAVFAVILLAAGAYFYRDHLIPSQAKNQPPQKIYTWKDTDGKTHYSGDKSGAPAHAKPADLPEIGSIETDQTALEKQAKWLKQKETAAESGDAEKPKLPQLRNLALERMEKAADNLTK